jgi:hypothetical protein
MRGIYIELCVVVFIGILITGRSCQDSDRPRVNNTNGKLTFLYTSMTNRIPTQTCKIYIYIYIYSCLYLSHHP